jgi:hypothetical protein
MPDVKVVIAVDKDQFEAAASAAEAAGLRIDPRGRMSGVGALSGTIDEAAIERLKCIPGVVSVERARTYRL